MTQSNVSATGLLKSQVIRVTRQPGQVWGFAGAALLLVLVAALASVAFVQGSQSGSMEVTPRGRSARSPASRVASRMNSTR